MRQVIKTTLGFSLLIMLASCGTNKKDAAGMLTDKKVQLEKLKKEKTALDLEIRNLEQDILETDPAAQAARAKLISVAPVESVDFKHFIELQGKVDADNIVIVTPRGMPAQVKQLFVKRGDAVRKGQLLAKLDDAVILQQIESLKTQLAYAKNIYQRQKNLWDQNIGTEVQLISAKNNVDGLEKQLATLDENWKTSFVYAPISGIADEVNVKVGETFTGVFGNAPQIRIVNTSSLKIVTEVPENYLGRIMKGTKVEVVVPDAGKTYQTQVSMTGASISPNSRAFVTEARIPADGILKVNQVAVVRMQDYTSNNTVVVSVNLVQVDESGKYVYVMARENDKNIARKKSVITGESYDGMVEVKSGLNAGDQIITEGYQTVYDGQIVTTGKS